MLLFELRQEVVEIGKKMASDGLVHDGQGNISAYDRERGYIVITPSADGYGEREPEEICVVDIDGEVIDGKWRPTSEAPLHYIYYREREDVNAVVHTHATHATVFGIIGEKAMPMVLNEAAMGLGGPLPVALYARLGTAELAEVTCRTTGKGVGAIMAHHGLVTVGDSLGQAYISTVAAEATAKAIILARSMGENILALDDEESATLREMYLKHYGAKKLK